MDHPRYMGSFHTRHEKRLGPVDDDDDDDDHLALYDDDGYGPACADTPNSCIYGRLFVCIYGYLCAAMVGFYAVDVHCAREYLGVRAFKRKRRQASEQRRQHLRSRKTTRSVTLIYTTFNIYLYVCWCVCAVDARMYTCVY